MANYTGVVKWFDNDRGYGFISANERLKETFQKVLD